MKKLNDKQRKLIEENYGLMGKFCKLHNIKFEEYSDVLSIALCESALLYDETKERIKFSTYAFRLMKNRWINEYKKNNFKQSKIPQEKIIYGDAYLNDDVELGSLIDNISSADNIEEIIIFKDMIYQLKNGKKILTERQKQMLDCVLIGLSNKQSQLILNLSLKRTEQIKSDLKNKICAFLECY